MNFKAKRTFESIKREELSKELTRLSGAIYDGKFFFDEKEIKLKDTLFLKQSLKVKDGRFYLDIQIKGDIIGQEREKSPEVSRKKKEKREKKKRPYEAKKIKKAMGGLWKNLSRAIRNQEQFPEEAELIELLDKYSKLTDPDWDKEWQICDRRVRELLDQTKKGDFTQAQHLIREVNGLIKSCHKIYK